MVLSTDEVNAIVNQASDATVTRLLQANLLATPQKKKARISWERNLSWEWANQYYLNYPKWFRQGVGNYPEAGKSLTYSKLRQYADIIIRLPDSIIIAECKMNPKPSIVSQLENYIMKFPLTPEFQKYKDAPVKGVIVSAMDVQDVHDMCDRYKIQYVVFKPSNFDAWYKQYILQGNKNNTGTS